MKVVVSMAQTQVSLRIIRLQLQRLFKGLRCLRVEMSVAVLDAYFV